MLKRFALAGFALAASLAQAAEEIVIGELNSYTRIPAFTEPYRQGWELAVEQINAAGGVDGRMIRVVSRDDAGDPAAAIRIAEELVARDGAAMIFGAFLSNVGLAVSEFARRNETLFLASEPLADAITWSAGHDWTFRLRPSTWMQTAMLAERAAELPATRWATIAPNYAYGQDAVEDFQKALKALRKDVEFVEAQWPPLGKIDAGASVRALEAAKPDAIFNVTFGADLARFVREGSIRYLFDGREVVSLLTGEPEYLEPLGDEAPEGWIVTGYPGKQIDTAAHNAFRDAYLARWEEEPKVGSVVGYNSVLSIATALKLAGSDDKHALRDAFEGLEVPQSPTGPFRFRAADHQATMGAYVGLTGRVDGQPAMVDWVYAPGETYLPSEEDAAALRPAP